MKKYFLATVFLSCLITAEVKAHPPHLSVQDESRFETRVSSKNAPQIRKDREDPPTFQSRLGSICWQGFENFRSNLRVVLPYVVAGILALEAFENLEMAEASPGERGQCPPGPAFRRLCIEKLSSMYPSIGQYLTRFYPLTNGSFERYCDNLDSNPSEFMALLDLHETVEQAEVWSPPQP